jgi:hypothetical protein
MIVAGRVTKSKPRSGASENSETLRPRPTMVPQEEHGLGPRGRR